jgi:hypothetical protein
MCSTNSGTGELYDATRPGLPDRLVGGFPGWAVVVEVILPRIRRSAECPWPWPLPRCVAALRCVSALRFGGEDFPYVFKGAPEARHGRETAEVFDLAGLLRCCRELTRGNRATCRRASGGTGYCREGRPAAGFRRSLHQACLRSRRACRRPGANLPGAQPGPCASASPAAARAGRPSSSRAASCRRAEITVKTARCARALAVALRASLECDLPRQDPGA